MIYKFIIAASDLSALLSRLLLLMRRERINYIPLWLVSPSTIRLKIVDFTLRILPLLLIHLVNLLIINFPNYCVTTRCLELVKLLLLKAFAWLKLSDLFNVGCYFWSYIFPVIVTQNHIDFVSVSYLKLHLFAVTSANTFLLIAVFKHFHVLVLLRENFIALTTLEIVITVYIFIRFYTNWVWEWHRVRLIINKMIVSPLIFSYLCISTTKNATSLFFGFIP